MDKILAPIKMRILQIPEIKGVSKKYFFEKIEVSPSNFRTNSLKSEVGGEVIKRILTLYDDISSEWLVLGKGKMIINNDERAIEKEKKKNMIPLYEDVATIGGTQQVADTTAVHNTPLIIDSGDWFQGATAAIRHYGDSMTEYKSGCLLAIRELKNKNEIIWGRNYVIETQENRITKQIAELDKNHIICFSSNTEKHENGILKHQPITIFKEDIIRISRVLGTVNKEESTGTLALI